MAQADLGRRRRRRARLPAGPAAGVGRRNCAGRATQTGLARALLATGNVNKNDPNDARSVAIAALRSKDLRPVAAEDHAAVLKLWSKRRRDLGSLRTQVVCRRSE